MLMEEAMVSSGGVVRKERVARHLLYLS